MHIDFLSISYPALEVGEGDELDIIKQIVGDDAFNRGGAIAPPFHSGGRAPFKQSIVTPTGTLFYTRMKAGALFEMGGGACRIVGFDVIRHRIANDKITRIDICEDYATDENPYQVASLARARARGHFISDEGETCYLGSPTSDTMTRIYKYNPPHERAGLLRVEHVFRRRYAERVCTEILAGNMAGIFAKRGLDLGLPPRYCGEGEPIEKWGLMPLSKPETKRRKWLMKIVIPAIIKGVNEGLITPSEMNEALSKMRPPA